MKNAKLKNVLSNLEKETKVVYYKSSGPGGQRKNKRETAVKLYHVPTGIKVIATESRSQSENKNLAFRRLKKKLTELFKRKKLRIPTSLPQTVKEKIKKVKKIHSEKKKLRKKIKTLPEY